MKNAHARSEHRDANWQTTRDQLKTTQNRADLLSLLGLTAICALLWVYHEPGDGFGTTSALGLGLALIVICVPVWIVARRKRMISARLTCQSCGYVPHDTEVSEITDTHQCPRCAQSLRPQR